MATVTSPLGEISTKEAGCSVGLRPAASPLAGACAMAGNTPRASEPAPAILRKLRRGDFAKGGAAAVGAERERTPLKSRHPLKSYSVFRLYKQTKQYVAVLAQQ